MPLSAVDMAAINQASLQSGVPVSLLSAIALKESSGNPTAVNPTSGATGLFQVLASTARDPGFGVTPLADRTDPYQSATFAGQYLQAQYQRTGSYAGAVSAYSGGSYGLSDLGLSSDSLNASGVTGPSSPLAPLALPSLGGATGSTPANTNTPKGLLNGIVEIFQRAGVFLLGVILVMLALFALLFRAKTVNVGSDSFDGGE